MTTATKTKAAKYTIDKATLQAAVHAVKAAVPSRSPKAVLHNVRIGDGLVTATDLEVRVDVELAGYDGPTVLLPYGRLAAILHEARGDEVRLTPGDTSCVVECGRGRWTLPTENPDEYPVSTPEGLKPVARLTPEQFRAAVTGVTYATDNDSSRYALGSVLLEVKGGVVSFVATDGRRLSLVTVETDQAVDDSQTLVLTHGIVLAARLVSGEESVQIEANGTEAVFTHAGVTVTSRLVQGRFPRWRDVIPSDRTVPLTKVSRGELLAATRAAAIVTSEQSKGVTFKFGECITLSAKSSESGESKVECEVIEAGNPTTVTLDPSYVVDWLRGLPSDSVPDVGISATDKASAVVFTSGDEFTGVVMPLDPGA